MNIKLVSISVTAALCLSAAAAWAGPRGERQERTLRRLPIERLAERLELSSAEVEALKEIDRRRVDRTAELHADRSILRYELDGLMAQAEPDQAAVFAKIDELGRVHAELQKAQFAARIELKKILGERADELGRLAREQRFERRLRRGREAPDAADDSAGGRAGSSQP